MQTAGMADSALAGVQRIATELRPRALDLLGLGPAVTQEVRRLATPELHYARCPAPKGMRSASGSSTVPSACWPVSSSATRRRGSAVPEPLSVWAN